MNDRTDLVPDDAGSGPVKVGVHVDVAGPQVFLHHNLVLLRVSAAEDQVVLRGDKPVELLEPVHLACNLEAALVRLLLWGGSWCVVACIFSFQTD